MQPHERVTTPVSKKQMIWNNFIGGLFWGIGTALGAILLLTILGFIVSRLNVIPFIGDFVAEVTQTVKEKESQTPLPFTESQE